MRKKILLGHLNSNGDCLFATVIARQIKEVDYPNCHLTWAVNDKCEQSVRLNPFVDEIWEIPTEKSLTSIEEWNAFAAAAENRKQNGEFDTIFLTQICGENWFNYDGGIRSSTYNNYPHKITVPHQPIIRLSAAEIGNVRRFAEKYRLASYEKIVLIECGPDSFEVALNPQSAYKLAANFSGNDRTAFILSSNRKIASARPNIIDGSELSFRENAELTEYCDLFVGCASGISWLATTDQAKKLPMILVINENNAVLPSVIFDHEYLNLPTSHIIEVKDDEHAMKKVKACLKEIETGGFAGARKIYNEPIRVSNYSFLRDQLENALRKRSFKKFTASLTRSVKRNGIRLLLTARFVEILWYLTGKAAGEISSKLGLKTGGKLTGGVKRTRENK